MLIIGFSEDILGKLPNVRFTEIQGIFQLLLILAAWLLLLLFILILLIFGKKERTNYGYPTLGILFFLRGACLLALQ